MFMVFSIFGVTGVTMREAAFGYCDLKKLESEASSFRDGPRQLCGPALKKMQTLFEKYVNL
jgi:hypothetical protein